MSVPDALIYVFSYDDGDGGDAVPKINIQILKKFLQFKEIFKYIKKIKKTFVFEIQNYLHELLHKVIKNLHMLTKYCDEEHGYLDANDHAR